MQQLGAPIEELFAEFEPEARAAASLAQVCSLYTSAPACLWFTKLNCLVTHWAKPPVSRACA